MFDSPLDRKVSILHLKPIHYMQQAMNLLLIDCFISDIDFQVAKTVYLWLFLNLS